MWRGNASRARGGREIFAALKLAAGRGETAGRRLDSAAGLKPVRPQGERSRGRPSVRWLWWEPPPPLGRCGGGRRSLVPCARSVPPSPLLGVHRRALHSLVATSRATGVIRASNYFTLGRVDARRAPCLVSSRPPWNTVMETRDISVRVRWSATGAIARLSSSACPQWNERLFWCTVRTLARTRATSVTTRRSHNFA